MSKTMRHTSIESKLSLAWLKDRSQRQQLLSDAAHYWPSEGLPFGYAMACTQVVLLYGKADKPYQEAKEAWDLPDCQLAMQDFRTAYLDKNETLRGWPSLWNEPDKFNDSQNFEYLLDRVAEFIKVGFNRETDQAKKTWKVVPSLDAPWLFKAVTTWALADYLGIKLEDWNKYKPLVCGGKVYDTEDIMTNKPTHRVHREVVSLFKRYGKLTHDGKLLKDADQWYKCRVNPGSIEEYMNELARQTEKDLDQGRISNDIAACDEATGYPRHK